MNKIIKISVIASALFFFGCSGENPAGVSDKSRLVEAGKVIEGGKTSAPTSGADVNNIPDIDDDYDDYDDYDDINDAYNEALKVCMQSGMSRQQCENLLPSN